MDLIRPEDVAVVTTKKFEKKYGVIKGSYVYVAGCRALPVRETDPYLQRVYAWVNTIDEDKSLNFNNGFIVDPRHLKRLDPSLYNNESILKDGKLVFKDEAIN